MHKKRQTEVHVNGHSIRFLLVATLAGMKKTIQEVAACPVITLHKFTHVTPPTQLLMAA